MEVGKGEDVGSDGVSLETVRVLHQTVVTLRTALEQSKNELHSLREKVKNNIDVESYSRTIENLSIENHILRQKVLGSRTDLVHCEIMSEDSKVGVESDSSGENDVFEDEVKDKINGLTLNPDKSKDPNFNKSSESNLDQTLDTPRISKGDSEDSEEVDDIELIFTTDDTKELGFQEDLVSIAETDGWKHKDEDIPLKLKQTWSQSVLVETDISKCGVIDENEPPSSTRRNTLPAPMPYRPIIHREVLSGSRGHLIEGSNKPMVKFSPVERSPRSVRPILVEKNSTKQESEAQTDITAVPLQWRSESFLAHQKVSQNFTTLPSKFTLPFCQRKQSLKLCEKTQEARRVLLSDINFTSMVPELSRSADHLCQETLMSRYPRAFSYMKNIDVRSPCDCGRWESASPSALDLSRRHSMRPSLSSLDTYWASPPQRPTWASVPSSPTHFYRAKCVPISSSYSKCSQHFDGNMSCGHSFQRPKVSRVSSVPGRHKVKFSDYKLHRGYPGQSLPDLRGDESEESTDSLIDESEDYLRKSIDSILTGVEPKRRYTRSHSQPEYSLGLKPPRCAQPYLVRVASDLHTGHWVKVIIGEGKTGTGLVRYVGPISGYGGEPWVGVQLANGLGNTDGTFNGARYFDCDVSAGLFVPFKKVIMAWSL
ncbi:uncharacterized protein [Halyomorpha halys]|uniref:uncharacterized protein isoform X2 n=1 Tax=Halyomorpha halys TaxID=286706 RepID=UPI0006D4CE32|nr:uncharacterized protein LOC106686987 [Halyomorpha halys]XP_014286098.1 uncharacterized protein LOC106686987 [Halyomorpha halys]XP_014286099.1 uncharacterized protein LOC106686987 [Halyomorpha halys]